MTKCGFTGNIWSKSIAFKACPEKYLPDFGEGFHNYHFRKAEKYLVKVIEPNIAWESFHDLSNVIYITWKQLLFNFWIFSAIKGHLLRAYYFINFWFNIFDTNEPKFKPGNLGWKLFSSMLIPSKSPKELITACAWKKSCINCCSCKRQNQACTEYCKCQNCGNFWQSYCS